MKEIIALASPPGGFTLDPANHDRLPTEDRLRPMPALTPIRLSMSLDEIVKPNSSQRVLQAKGGLHHKFKAAKVNA
jgi:hypothetical protein